VPTVLLYQSAIRMRPGALYACAVMVVFGFIANRLNVGTTGLEAGSGTHYVPRWSEVAVTLSIVAAGFAIFRMIAEYFPIFEASGTGIPACVVSPGGTGIPACVVSDTANIG